jgi:hypothetical protein
MTTHLTPDERRGIGIAVLTAAAVAAATAGVNFLFAEGQRLLAERRERKAKAATTSAEAP